MSQKVPFGIMNDIIYNLFICFQALKIKLAEGTPAEYLKKTEQDEMNVKPVLQVITIRVA